ncbi:MAG TPA: DUF4149 domain-containing protein [Thermoanaerobaculia bacterium]|jgi:putative copper export protein
MPNWLHLLTNFLYHLGLALWIGGALALGALVAPLLFRTLPRLDAGRLFGTILRRFARLRLAAIVLVIIAAAVKHFVWETNASVWIAVRWAAIAFLAFAVLYEVGFLERALEARRVHLTPEMPEDHPDRRGFQQLHRRAEGLMKVSVLAAAVAMLLS